MKHVIRLFGCLMVLILQGQAMAQKSDTGPNSDWQVSVSVGAILVPQYTGDNDYRLMVVPGISAKYGEIFFASVLEGVGLNLLNSEALRAGPIIKFDFGREQDGGNAFAVNGDSTNDLRGLGDVDETAEVGGFVEFSIRQYALKFELRQGLDGHEGLIAEAGLEYRGQTMWRKRPLLYSLGPQVKLADTDYLSAYYDVDATQSAASGLAQYDAGAGFVSAGFKLSAVRPVNSLVTLIGFATYEALGSEIADSSLVRQRGRDDQVMAGLILSYSLR